MIYEKKEPETPAQNTRHSLDLQKRQIGTPEILENQAEKSGGPLLVNFSQRFVPVFRLENIENIIITRFFSPRRPTAHFTELCMFFLIYELNSFIFISFGSSPNKVKFYVNARLSIFL